MAKSLEKKISAALKQSERWFAKQPAWSDGNLSNESGSVVSHRGPVILSEHDCVLHFARMLNEAGVPWRDLHLELSPGQWLVERGKIGQLPPRIDLAIVDHKRFAKRSKPFAPGEKGQPLLDAVFEFKLASNYWVRKLASGADAKPPKKVGESIAQDREKVQRYIDTRLAARAYVVIVEEADHGWKRPSTKAVDGVSTHYLKCF